MALILCNGNDTLSNGEAKDHCLSESPRRQPLTKPIRHVFFVVVLFVLIVNVFVMQSQRLRLVHNNAQSSEWMTHCLPLAPLESTVESSSEVDIAKVDMTPTTVITKNDKHTCVCELISTDCLDSIRCLPETLEKSREGIIKGVLTREVMKKQSTFSKPKEWSGLSPVGKATQYLTQDSWLAWIYQQGDLPDVLTSESLFINETRYPYCIEHHLDGRDCFFTKPRDPEELGDFEALAMDMMNNDESYSANKTAIVQTIQAEIHEYLNKSFADWNDLHGLEHLLSFANVGRILFNRQPHVRELCQRIQSYVNGSTVPSKLPPDAILPMSQEAMTISLHLRRADSCDHLIKPFSPVASSIDSHAQPSSLRKCYATHVYLDELRRVQQNMPSHRKSMEVFLSTDNSRSVMKEIQLYDMEFFQSITWHVLDISREIFKYDGLVEGDTHSNHASLGESAVADLWLLSHGEVFIGHLGSRFGKVGWMLATSRYQRFIPFFSVDGHSFCCEVDEPCGAVKPYIRSMQNCMTFSHELYGAMELNPGYWEFGSLKRIMVALQDDAMRMEAEEANGTSIRKA